MTNGIGRVGWRNFVSAVSAPTNNPLWDNLVAYYTGDNTPNDAKGVYNGTLTNGATYATGKINNGFSLDGINDYVSISPTFGSTFSNNASPHTYSAWIYPTNVTDNYNWIFQNGSGSKGTSMIINLNRLGFFFDGGNALVTTTSVITVNAWNYVVCVYNGVNQVKFYVNGNLVGTSTASWTDAGGATSTYIGSYAGAAYFFNGSIDEVGVWNRTLTAAEVTELYNAGAGKQYVAPAYTTRTAAFATATGITDTTILNALNTFDAGLISNGLATKMKALYPMVGGTSTTHRYNFMDARDVDAAFRLVFNGGWVHSSTGAQPNGTNGYANTYFNHVNNGNDKNNFGLTIYSRTNSTGFKVDIGAVTDVYSWIAPRASSTLDYVGIYDNSIFSGNFATSSLGLFTVLRNSLTSQKFFQNGILKGQRNGFSSNQPYYGTDINLNIYISCRNSFSQASNFSDRQLAFSGIHDSLTDAEALTFYNLVQAMQTTLSRQV